jgi:hypothetical protein
VLALFRLREAGEGKCCILGQITSSVTTPRQSIS